MTNKLSTRALSLLLVLLMLTSLLCGCKKQFSSRDIPEYSGKAYVEINGNKPYFTKKEITDKPFESYSELDGLGRCGVAFACVGPETMPTEERGEIANIIPTGWEYNGVPNNNYYEFIEGNYLYNRCHLIAHRLAGEDDNEKNLITGTRYMNIEGMLTFEAIVSEYINRTGNHVMYRVTPIFRGLNYVAEGVLMEGYSVEDSGDGVCFCIFAYNVQPGVYIDYFTGANIPEGGNLVIPDAPDDNDFPSDTPEAEIKIYIINTNSKKFHYANSSCVDKIKEENRKEFEGTRDEIIAEGYSPCGNCKP